MPPGLVDLSAFAVLDVTGPGALDAVQSVAVAQLDVAPGRVVYTSLLDEAGGFVGDLTDHAAGPAALPGGDRRRHRHVGPEVVRRPPAATAAAVTDLTSAWTTLGLWGPRARDVLAVGDRRRRLATTASRSAPAGRSSWAGSTVLASRISYVGELGWELHAPIEQGARVWDTLWEAGRPAGLVPVGIGVYGTTGRLEKGYRAFGAELDADYNLVEAGMTRPRVKAAGLRRPSRPTWPSATPRRPRCCAR